MHVSLQQTLAPIIILSDAHMPSLCSSEGKLHMYPKTKSKFLKSTQVHPVTWNDLSWLLQGNDKHPMCGMTSPRYTGHTNTTDLQRSVVICPLQAQQPRHVVRAQSRTATTLTLRQLPGTCKLSKLMKQTHLQLYNVPHTNNWPPTQLASMILRTLRSLPTAKSRSTQACDL